MNPWERIAEMMVDYPLSFLPDYLLLLGVISGFLNLRYLDAPTKIVWLLLVLCLLVEAVLIYYAAQNINNHFLINLSSLIETACLAGAYYLEIVQRRSRQLILSLFFIYLLTFIVSFERMRIADYLLTVERLVLVVFVVLHFGHILSRMRIPNILAYSMFWVSASVMIYAAGTFFIFLFTRVTLGHPHLSADFLWYWSIVRWFTCLFYVTLTVTFYLRRREVLVSAN